MKKHAKFLAVLSTTAAMAAVTPGLTGIAPFLAQNAFAASAGWFEEDGELRYRDKDGYMLTDSWKKMNNEWYYLDEDGSISRSMKIDEYYVNEDGVRVQNTWISEDNEDNWDDDEPETYWYYYGKDGKAVVSKWINIEGKEYYFNEDGRMQTGKISLEEYTYYLGNDGSMKRGWIQLDNEDEQAEEDKVWHYFDNRGRMIQNEIDRKIDGAYYTFADGILQTGWYKLPAAEANAANSSTAASGSNIATNSEASESSQAESEAAAASSADASNSAAAQTPAQAIAAYQYYETDGKRASGWRTIEGVNGIHEEGEEFTFYFKEGKPYHAQTGIQIFTIDSKRYGFNTLGERQTDLQSVTLEDGVTKANYYFGEDGIVRTGKQTIFNEDLGDNQTWFFLTDGGSKGQGYHGIRDNSIFVQGLRQDADRDLRFAPVSFDGSRYLVNASGAIQKASASSKSTAKPELGNGFKDVKDTNGTIWTVNTSGIIQE